MPSGADAEAADAAKAAEDAKAAADAAAKAAADAKTAADAAAAKLQDDLDAAEAKVTELEGKLDDATGDTPGGTTDLQDQLDAAIAERDRLQGELDEATVPTVDPDPARTEAAPRKRRPSPRRPRQTDDAGLGGSGDDTHHGHRAPSIRHGPIITDSDLMGDDDPMFEQAMDLGGGRTMHVRTMEADDDGDVVEEVVIVSTDIEAPKATAFEEG